MTAASFFVHPATPKGGFCWTGLVGFQIHEGRFDVFRDVYVGFGGDVDGPIMVVFEIKQILPAGAGLQITVFDELVFYLRALAAG